MPLPTTPLPPVGLRPLVLGAGASGEGQGSITLKFPRSTPLAGTRIDATWYLMDPGAPGGRAVSPTARLTWF